MLCVFKKPRGYNLFHYGHFLVDGLFPIALLLDSLPPNEEVTLVLQDHIENHFGGLQPMLLDMFPRLRLTYVDRMPVGPVRDLRGFGFGPYPSAAVNALDRVLGQPSSPVPQDLVLCIERGLEPVVLDRRFRANLRDTGKNRRYLKNHAEVVTILKEFASRKQWEFENVMLENMPWREQRALFQRARIVFGQHGAGMCNVAFCLSGSKTVVLETSYFGLDTVKNLAAVRGLTHHFVQGDKFSCNLNSLRSTLSRL